MIIAGLQRVTLIDYPSKIACVVFLHGCNFRCPFCHNPELVIKEPELKNSLSENEFFNFLKNRKDKLDGVVITGGEPLLNPELESFIKKIKQEGFLVKIDTNGSNPDYLKKLFFRNLIDYLAMDVKTGLQNYQKLVCWEDIDKIKQSIDLIIKSKVNYEFRTTLVKGLHTEKDIKDIALLIKGAKAFVIQNFRSSTTISSDLSPKNEFTKNELQQFMSLLRGVVDKVSIRNTY